MLQIASSGNDVVVGKTIPSIATDSSKGTGTTRPVSSSNIRDVRNAGSDAVIVRPPPKFNVRKLAVISAST